MGYDFEMVKYIVIRGDSFLYYRFSLVFIHVYIYIIYIYIYIYDYRFCFAAPFFPTHFIKLSWGWGEPPKPQYEEGVRCQTIKNEATPTWFCEALYHLLHPTPSSLWGTLSWQDVKASPIGIWHVIIQYFTFWLAWPNGREHSNYWKRFVPWTSWHLFF